MKLRDLRPIIDNASEEDLDKDVIAEKGKDPFNLVASIEINEDTVVLTVEKS